MSLGSVADSLPGLNLHEHPPHTYLTYRNAWLLGVFFYHSEAQRCHRQNYIIIIMYNSNYARRQYGFAMMHSVYGYMHVLPIFIGQSVLYSNCFNHMALDS